MRTPWGPKSMSSYMCPLGSHFTPKTFKHRVLALLRFDVVLVTLACSHYRGLQNKFCLLVTITKITTNKRNFLGVSGLFIGHSGPLAIFEIIAALKP